MPYGDIVYRQKRKDHVWFSVAREIAKLSKDPSTKVGCVVIDKGGRVVSTGYNGFPAAIADDPSLYAERDTKYPLVIHAELNALLYADRKDTVGGTIYITIPPCGECAKHIAAMGITRIVCGPTSGRFPLSSSELVREKAGISISIIWKEETCF